MRLPQYIPRAIRVAVGKVSLATILRHLLNQSLDKVPVIVPLGPPLVGHQMRLWPQGQKAYIYGVYEPAVGDVIQHYVQPNWNFVDIGGHIGYLTLLLAKRVGPEGQVFAFEPLADNFEVLKENVLLNGYKNVHAVCKAILNMTGTTVITLGRDGPLPMESRLLLKAKDDTNGIVVQAITLDEYLASQAVSAIEFVKIDAEGAEAVILERMRETLHRHKPLVLLEVHDLGGQRGREPGSISSNGCWLPNFNYWFYGYLPIDVHRYRGHLLAIPD